jgi:hypothetical protein
MENKTDLNEYKARRAGIVTPLSLSENVLNSSKAGKVKKLISIAIMEDGALYVGWAGKINNFELMGILEGAKDEIKAILSEDD